MFSKSAAFLREALQRREASAIALLAESGNAKAEFYLGDTAHENGGAELASVNAETLFDLASLTKIFCTTALLFHAESENRIHFSDPVTKYFPSFKDPSVKLLDLMNHSSGLPAHIEFFKRYIAGDAKFGDQNALRAWVLDTPVSEEKKQVYSDLGFLLLGFLLEDIYRKPLPFIFEERIRSRLKLENTGFVSLPHTHALARMHGLLAEKKRFAATEKCPWRKKILQGEVHDDNAWAVGGYGGHAGLFSNAEDAYKMLQHLRRLLSASPGFRARLAPEAGRFSFGTMTYPGLRAFPGEAFSGAFGHTGFTGTSAWFHEPSHTGVILLSNRVHPSREDGRWIDTRLRFHTLLWEEAGL